MNDDTIVAIATPPGRGGIGVVRVSGPDAVTIVRTALIRGNELEARRATFVRVAAPDGGVVDQSHGNPLSARRALTV